MKKTSGILFALLLVWASVAKSQQSDEPKGEFSGLVFTDFFWVAASHDDSFEGSNGFWIRRVYFTYDRDISESFTARLRLEGSSEGDFFTGAKITPVVKDLYLRWENETHQVYAGISSTPTFGLVEDVWGYRPVEKAPQDLLGFGSSRDFGLAAKGHLDNSERLNYHFMFGNGNSNSSEINKGKKLMLALSYELTDHLVLEVYGDWNDNRGNEDWLTLQGFAAYRSENFNLGFLFTHQNRANAVSYTVGSRSDLNLELASVFTNFTISETTRGFLRIDRTFDAFPGIHQNDYFPISNQAEATILIAGLDIDLGSDIHLMPNVEATTYSENDRLGITPDNDLIPRLTLFYNF